MRWPASGGLDVKRLPLMTILVLIKEAKKGFLLDSQIRFCLGSESSHLPAVPLNLSVTEKPLKSGHICSFQLNSQLVHREVNSESPSILEEDNLINHSALFITLSYWLLL